MDHGVAFLHGRDPGFIAELNALDGTAGVWGWLLARVGAGLPCQPGAFDADERRLAPGEGVTRFAKHLARGLDVRLNEKVVAMRRVPP